MISVRFSVQSNLKILCAASMHGKFKIILMIRHRDRLPRPNSELQADIASSFHSLKRSGVCDDALFVLKNRRCRRFLYKSQWHDVHHKRSRQWQDRRYKLRYSLYGSMVVSWLPRIKPQWFLSCKWCTVCFRHWYKLGNMERPLLFAQENWNEISSYNISILDSVVWYIFYLCTAAMEFI